MKTVPPHKGKHQSRVTADDVAFYYAKKCYVLPNLHFTYFEFLSQLESQDKICLTPAAILERYHMNLTKKLGEKRRKHAINSR